MAAGLTTVVRFGAGQEEKDLADQRITEDFVKALPKTDLHVHLDGSIRPATLIDLARNYRQLPLHRGWLKGLGLQRTVRESERIFDRLCIPFQFYKAKSHLSERRRLALNNQNEGVRYRGSVHLNSTCTLTCTR